MLTTQFYEDFTSVDPDWRECIENQTLFNTLDWCRSWWSTWGEQLAQELKVIAVYDGNMLVGVLPLYKVRYPNDWGLPKDQWQPVGSHYPTGETVLSEYSGVISREGYAESACQAVKKALKRLDYSSFVFPFTTATNQIPTLAHLPLLSLQEGEGVSIEVTGSFSDYQASLGKNTRLKSYNRRQLLDSLGAVVCSEYTVNELENFFQHLNRFHVDRWGEPCFGEYSQSFYRRLFTEVDQSISGIKPVLSILSVDDEVISVLFNIEYNSITYNMQAGFNQSFHPKLALGSLHLGYAIEEAFNRQDISQFDLLFGEGKNTFYKRNLIGNAGREVSFSTQVAFDNYLSYCKYRIRRLLSR